MRYVGGGTRESGCIFCTRLADDDDVGSLIIHRGPRAFVILNRYPYNTGHLMLVPNDHVPDFESLDSAAIAGMAGLLPGLTRALRRSLGCDGFNIGVNVGAVAGAGVAAHLHQHVVPRWLGDANFMPILASTMVLPELIPVTYAKLRAELERELHPTHGDGSEGAPPGQIRTVLLAEGDTQVLLVGPAPDGHLPRTAANPDEPLWRAAIRGLELPAGVELAGWAGDRRTGSDAPPALAFRLPAGVDLPATPGAGARWIPIATALATLVERTDRDTLRDALDQLAPSIGPA